MEVLLLYYFYFIVKHQLNAQIKILIKYSRSELKTKIYEKVRVTRGCTSRDLRRVTDKVSATSVHDDNYKHTLPFVENREPDVTSVQSCATLFLRVPFVVFCLSNVYLV